MANFTPFVAVIAAASVIAGCTTKPEVAISNRTQVVIEASSPAAAAKLASTQCARYDRDAYYDKLTNNTHWFTCKVQSGGQSRPCSRPMRPRSRLRGRRRPTTRRL